MAATGICSTTLTLKPWGNCVEICKSFTTGNGDTARWSFDASTSSVVILRAVATTAERIFDASGPAAPTTVTRFTATSEESRNQSQPPTRTTSAAASAATTLGRSRGNRRELRGILTSIHSTITT